MFQSKIESFHQKISHFHAHFSSICRHEWEWLQNLAKDGDPGSSASPSQLAFHWSIASAAKMLLYDLDVNNAEMESHR